MSAFKGLGQAQIFGNGKYLEPNGRFKMRLDRIFVFTTRKKETALVAECTVLESASTTSDPNHKVSAPGAKRSWFQKMNVDAAMPAVKEFSYALLGYDRSADSKLLETSFDPVLEALMEEICNEDPKKFDGRVQPFKGRTIGVETSVKITKERKVEFTRHDWFPTDGKVPTPSAA